MNKYHATYFSGRLRSPDSSCIAVIGAEASLRQRQSTPGIGGQPSWLLVAFSALRGSFQRSGWYAALQRGPWFESWHYSRFKQHLQGA